MKLLKLGSISLDGTKVHANASRHSALSHGHIDKLQSRLRGEVQELLALAEQADGADIPDGMKLPEELKRRQDRMAAMQEAKTKIQGRTQVRFERAQAESRPNWHSARSGPSKPARSLAAGPRSRQRPVPGRKTRST